MVQLSARIRACATAGINSNIDAEIDAYSEGWKNRNGFDKSSVCDVRQRPALVFGPLRLPSTLLPYFVRYAEAYVFSFSRTPKTSNSRFLSNQGIQVVVDQERMHVRLVVSIH